MTIRYTISPYPSLLENMVVKIWEITNTSNGAEVFTQTLPQPHNTSVVITANGLDTITHKVGLYTASGTQLHFYDVQPTVDTVNIFTPIQFKIGDGQPDTPAVDTNAYTNVVMSGLTSSDYLVFRTGYGVLIEGTHIANNPLGGFTLLIGGDVFNADEEFTIVRQPKTVQTIVNDSVVAKWFGGFVTISSPTDYANTHLRKLISLSGQNAIFTFTNSVTPPIGYGFIFNNFEPFTIGQPDPKIVFNNADLKYNGATVSELSIPPQSTVGVVFDGTNWNCFINDIKIPTIVTGTILKVGNIAIGSVPPSPTIYSATFTPALTTDQYVVMGNLVSATGLTQDFNLKEMVLKNTIATTGFSLKITGGGILNEDVSYDYVVVKR